jgi:hypothetical protein
LLALLRYLQWNLETPDGLNGHRDFLNFMPYRLLKIDGEFLTLYIEFPKVVIFDLPIHPVNNDFIHPITDLFYKSKFLINNWL